MGLSVCHAVVGWQQRPWPPFSSLAGYSHTGGTSPRQRNGMSGWGRVSVSMSCRSSTEDRSNSCRSRSSSRLPPLRDGAVVLAVYIFVGNGLRQILSKLRGAVIQPVDVLQIAIFALTHIGVERAAGFTNGFRIMIPSVVGVFAGRSIQHRALPTPSTMVHRYLTLRLNGLPIRYIQDAEHIKDVALPHSPHLKVHV